VSAELWTPGGLWLLDDDLDLLTDRELAEYEAVLEAEAADLLADEALRPWRPQPRQADMARLARQADETLVGGAKGGGKTEFLLHYHAAECEAYPGNLTVIFRRVFPSLRRTVLPRARAILRGRAVYNENDHTFRFPNGSTLLLATLQYEKSALDYAGAEFGLVSFEELTEFTEDQYEYLLTCLRAPVPGVRPHAVSSTNPTGPGREWVRRRFVRPHANDVRPGETAVRPDPAPGEDPGDPNVRLRVVDDTPWRPAPRDDPNREGPPMSTGLRVYVPATLADNPEYERRDPGYRARIAAIRDPARRKALLGGDWDAEDITPGALWTRGLIEANRCRPPAMLRRLLVAVDPNATGSRDECGIVAGGLGVDGRAYVIEDRTTQLGPGGDPGGDDALRGWGRTVVETWDELAADGVVAEQNNGHDMVLVTVRAAAEGLGVLPRPVVEKVNASRGKERRASPVAQATYDGRIGFAGRFPKLEEELVTWTAEAKWSPNRLDAFVWLMSALLWPRQRRARRATEVVR
jgi:terminase large subunit-like protein